MTPRIAPVLAPVAIALRARWKEVVAIAEQLASMSEQGTADAYLTHGDMSVRLSLGRGSDTIRAKATLHGPAGLTVLDGALVVLPREATDGIPDVVRAAVPGRPFADLVAISGTALEALAQRIVAQVRGTEDGCLAVVLDDALEDPSPIADDGPHAAIADSSMSCGR